MIKYPYKKCKDCLAHYPDRQGYKHRCDGLMKYLVTIKKKVDFVEVNGIGFTMIASGVTPIMPDQMERENMIKNKINND